MSEELEVTYSQLDERERYALKKWQSSDHPPLSHELNAKLFRLFLNGKTTHEIHRLNSQYSLGQIVNARIKGEWDRRYQEHLDELLTGVKLRVQQVTLETIDFFADLISAANQMHGDAIKRYLQTKDPKDLGGIQITNLAGYKTAIELLQKLTGQDKQNKVGGELTVIHEAGESMKAVETKLPTAEEAAEVLKLLAAVSKKD